MSLERNYKLYVHIAPNGKKYYGITGTKPKYRWNNGKGYDKNKHFASAIKKYGWNNIRHIVLQEGLDKEEAEELEQYMIQWYNTTNHEYGYNVSLGGETGPGLYGENHPSYGKTFSEEHKRKMSEAKRGRKRSEEEIKTFSGANNAHSIKVICITTGKIFDSLTQGSEYYNIKGKGSVSKCCKGEAACAGSLSDGTKLVWSFLDDYNNGIDRHANKTNNIINNSSMKQVICITTNKIFNSMSEGARYYNISHASVSHCCSGKSKSAGSLSDGTKLVWRYLDDYNNGIDRHIDNIQLMKKKRTKPVVCITTNKVFDSAKEGAEYYNIAASSITYCCKGKVKIGGKYNGIKLVWRYLDDNNNYIHKCKKIICTTTNKVFNTLKDSAIYYNVALSSISSCCNGRVKSAGKLPDGTKLVWRYIDIIEL